jgi:AraC-like DNA-binding protein
MGVTDTAREPMVRVGPMANMAALTRSLGQDPAPLFDASRFSTEEFLDPDHVVPFIPTSQLLARCAKATHCDHFGLLLGQRAEPSHLGIAGFLVRAAPSVEIALASLQDNIDLHDTGGSLALDVGSDYTTMTYRVDYPGVSALTQIYDMSATMMFQVMRMICGNTWYPASVYLERRRPEDTGIYERFFRAALYFDSTECALTFQTDWLMSVPPTSDALLFNYLNKEASALHDSREKEFKDLLPVIFRRAILARCFSAAEVAGNMGLHERTLHRRLKQAGTSFRTQLDLARQAISQELLESTRLPVSEIAGSAGYSDSSTFIRAFQRWAGVTPVAWRKMRSNQITADDDHTAPPLH